RPRSSRGGSRCWGKAAAAALAVNTTDGSVTYSVAFALVRAEDGGSVDTRNEAYAFPGCSGCARWPVGFQVGSLAGSMPVGRDQPPRLPSPQRVPAAVVHSHLDAGANSGYRGRGLRDGASTHRNPS
ncbi:hypothetical protein, partial [Paenarthrobacter sp.]|uniref:hypothetical protein n=1 Tax=Paenarthrobacter sp. TaxID=1931993 RepID=UPI002810D430